MDKQTIINKNISIDVKHIDGFELELKSGTKKMKEKFHRDAIKERNAYVNKELDKFSKYQKDVYNLIKNKVNEIYPTDNTFEYDKYRKVLSNYKTVIIFNNDKYSSFFKLNIFSLISKIDKDDSVSLNDINNILSNIFNIFKDAGVSLSADDFSYSMFTYEYMSLFINSFGNNNFNDIMKNSFDNIYWECPDIIKHLKLNLWFLMDKYKDKLDSYCKTKAFDLLNSTGLSKNELLNSYLKNVSNLDKILSRDDFNNLEMFMSKKKNILDYLADSSTRTKNFDQFVIDGVFSDITDTSKFYNVMVDLAHTLSVLKMYYRYEFIIKDMQDKYNKRNENKTLYEQKLKEIKTEEAKRSKIYNDYLKATGKKGLFHRVNLQKEKSTKLAINEEISKLVTLYDELHDLEIVDMINKNITNVSSLYDLLALSYNSYYYLEKMFKEHFSENINFSFDEELDKFFDFIYSPYNEFLTKIYAFTNSSVAFVIVDKYRLLGINVTSDNISNDSLDAFMDTVNYVKTVYDVSKSKLSLENINFIIKFKNFDPVEDKDDVNEDIL
jgi:hypothetical protein